MKKVRILPGFGLTLGITMTFLLVMVILPLGALTMNAFALGWSGFWQKVLTPAALASYRLTIFSSFGAAVVNGIFGFIAAWTLVRYSFPGRKILDAFVDLPFAVPGSIGGIALAAMVSQNGLLGRFLIPRGIQIAYTPWGVMFALVFAGLPFVIRSMQPVIENLDPNEQEAARLLGASGFQIFRRIWFPSLLPSLIQGCTLSFIRGLGEFGTVIFVAGNIPFRSEVTTQVIYSRIDQYDRAGAAAISFFMLIITLVLLILVTLFRYAQRNRWSVAGGKVQ